MNFNRHLSILVVLLTFTLVTHRLDAQEFSAGINTETPNPNAVLHLVSPNGDQGLLIPKLTILQRTNLGTALGTADEGIMVYDEEEQRFYFWDGTRWVFINSGISGAISAVTSDATLTGDGAATILGVNTGTLPNQIVQLDGAGNLPSVDGSALTGVTADGFSGNLAGDVTGTQNATVVNSVGGQTAVNVATATGIVNGAPALDVDATDDFDQNSTPLGAFTGTTITDNTMLTNALQELETAVEGFTAVSVDGTTITGDGNATPLSVGTVPAVQVSGLSVVATTGAFADLLTIPAGLADGDDIGLATVNVDGTTITGDGDVTALAVGNVPAASVTGLSAVATTGSFGDLITIPAGLADGDDVGLTAVTSADITDDEIVNLDINAGADIAATKLQATVMVEGENVSLLNNDAGYLTAIAELDPVWTADRTTLGTAGTINDPGNLIEWTRLKGIPVGFSDGVDDGLTAVTSADITNGEIVDADVNVGAAIGWTKINKTGANVSELANDAGYLTAFTELDPVWTADRTTLGTAGTINDPGNLIEWTRLKGIPVGFSDGVDDGLIAVTSADITNNEILDADINAAAAIAATKLQATVMVEGENVGLLNNDAGYLAAVNSDATLGGDGTAGTPLAVNVGLAANQIVQLDGLARLPGVDGSQLTNVIASTLAANSVGTAEIADGTIADIDVAAVGWGKLTGVPAGFADNTDDGLTAVNVDGTTIVGNGAGTALSVNVGNGANQVVQLNGLSQLPAVNGSLLTNVDATTVANNAVGTGQIVDGAIVDIDVSGTANITATKLQATVMVEGENVSLLNNDAGFLTAFTELDPVWTGDRTTLGTVGTINDPGNLIEWTRLKGIPPDFSDGVDDGLTTVNVDGTTITGDGDATALAVEETALTIANTQVTGLGTASTEDAGTATGELLQLPVATAGDILEYDGANWVIDVDDVGLTTVNVDGTTITGDGDATALAVEETALTIANTQVTGLGTASTEDAGTATGELLQLPVATAGDILEYDGANWVIDVDDVGLTTVNVDGTTITGDGDATALTVEETALTIANTQVTGLGTASTEDAGDVPGNLLQLPTATTGEVLEFDGTNWVAGTDDAGLWTDNAPNISYTAGNVGVGVVPISARFEVSANGADPIARFDKASALTGSGIVIDMNDAVAPGRPAIVINDALIPIQIPGVPSSDGKILISDGSGNMTFQDGFGTRFETTNYLAVNSGGAASIATGAANNIVIGGTAAQALTTGDNNIAVGSLALIGVTTGTGNIGIGVGSGGGTLTTGTGNVLIGEGAIVSGGNPATSNNVGIGPGTTVQNGNSVAIGNGADAIVPSSIAIGNGAGVTASGQSGIAIGTSTSVTTSNSVAIGNTASASADAAVAIGNGALADKANTVTIGNRTATRLNLEVTGAQYVAVRSLSGVGIAETVRTDDYILYFEPGTTGNVTLPPASAENVGRKLIFCTDAISTFVDIQTDGATLDLIFANGAQNSITINRDPLPGMGVLTSITVVLVSPNRWMVVGSEGVAF